MYHVRRKEDRAVVFRSTSRLQCDMTAISLTLASLYDKKRVYEVVDKTTVLMTVTPELAFGMMQARMRLLVANRRVTPKMAYVPETPLLSYAEPRIIAAVKAKESLDPIKKRLSEEVDKLADKARTSLA